MSKSMKKVVLELLTNYNLQQAFEQAQGGMFHLRLENKPYMPLVIEKVLDDLVSIAHYGEQNGDAMRDPEMIFRIVEGQWIPASYQNDYTGMYQEVPSTSTSGALTLSLTSFANTWVKNIRAQGWLEKERVKATSLTHQWVLDGKDAPEPEQTEAAYEDLVSNREDYEPSPYDGTYSEM